MPINSNPPADPLNNPYGIGGYGSGLLGNAPIENMPIGYYQNLLSSEYQPPSSPKWNALLQLLLKKFDDASQCLVQMDTVFDLDYAVGVQLDSRGAIEAVSRTLPFNPRGTGIVTVNPVFTATVLWVSGGQFITDGSWNGLPITLPTGTYTISTVPTPTSLDLTAPLGFGLTGVGYSVNGASQVLDDATYRLLIKATIAQNQWDGTITGMQPIWQSLFPGGTIIIADNQDMTADIILAGSFSSIIVDMINNGMIVPRPEGVLYNYEFPTLPVFGFGEENAYVSGFGTGHWA